MKPRSKKILTVAGTLTLFVCVVLVCFWSHAQARNQLCAGLENGLVQVNDPANSGFVSADSITAELFPMLDNLTQMRLADVNLGALRKHILSLDKIESAEVTRLNNNQLRVRVTPMVPVARVWPTAGRSYYVNREGKRISAERRFKIDVPQLYGDLPGGSPAALLPLLDYLNSDADMNRMVTMISASDSANIILVPAIRGHVINLGDASDIADKFSRLKVFYSKVLPVKGWEFYDTISLKWDNQIVATRRKGKLPDLRIEIIDELEHEEDDLETMQTTLPPKTQKKK